MSVCPCAPQVITSLLTHKAPQRPDTNALLRNANVIAKVGGGLRSVFLCTCLSFFSGACACGSGLWCTLRFAYALCVEFTLPPLPSQAKALGIDMQPRTSGNNEDKPVYEQQGGGYPAQQQPQQAGYYPLQQPGQGQYPGGQPYQQPYYGSQQGAGGYPGGRPGSARQAPPGAHPFDLPQNYGGQGQGYPPQQPQQRQQVVVPQNAPFAVGQIQQDPWDAMADEIQRIQLGTAEFNRCVGGQTVGWLVGWVACVKGVRA